MAHVVLIASYGPSLVRFRGKLIEAMLQRGHTLTAMSPEDEEPAGLHALGARWVQLKMDRTGANPLHDARVVVRLAKVLRRLNPDVVLSYTAKPVVYGTLASRMARVPKRCALVTGLGYLFIDDNSTRQKLVRMAALPLYRMALASAHVVMTQNPDDTNDLRQAGILSMTQPVVQVAGSGIDLIAFPQKDLPKGPPVFLFVGRLLRDKGVREFVEAARQVKAQHPDTVFRLVGPADPNPAGISNSEITTWQEDPAIEMIGELSDVRPALEACAVFVLPSYREGTPRSVLEAMSTGRAIITTDAPGCRETVIDGQNGYLVPPKNAEALAAAIQRYLKSEHLIVTHGQASRALAESRFDVHRVNDTMLNAMGL